MKRKYIYGCSVILALCIGSSFLTHVRATGSARVSNPTPVPDGQYIIDGLIIDVNGGHSAAGFNLIDASGNDSARRTNNHAFLIDSEFNFKDGVYDKGSLIRVSNGGSDISLITNSAGVHGK